MRYSLGNNPTFTFDELLEKTRGVLAGDVGDEIVADSLVDALEIASPHLKSVFRAVFTTTCTSQCEVDLGMLDVREIVNVRYKHPRCHDISCWSDLTWWDLVGQTLILPRITGGMQVMVEFLADPPVWSIGEEFVLDGEFTPGEDAQITVAMPTVKIPREPGHIPTAGYLRFDGSEYVAEYVGRTATEDTITFQNVAGPDWVTNEPIAQGSKCRFALVIRSPMLLEAVRMATLANYWSRKLTLCTGDEDRSFASQMMVFYSGERDKRWREVGPLSATYKSRLKFKPSHVSRRMAYNRG